MTSPDTPDPWDKLVGAARESGAAETKVTDEAPPPGFVSRLASLRGSLLRFARTLLWRRWSAVAAVAALVLYLVVYLILKSNPSEVAPVLPIPLPPEP